MVQGYNPPQAYGTTYSPTRGYSGERSNSSPNYWGEIQKMKEKYYDSLTSNLLIVFALVCVVRAAALGLQLSQTAECPNIPKLLALNILNYALWAFLFLMSYKFFQSGNGGALSAVNLACWANLVFKIIVTGLLGTASDLQGNCFLERGFKTWTWIVGGAEAVLFIFLLVRIQTGVTNFNKNK